MQNRIRKSRCIEIIRNFGKSKASCIHCRKLIIFASFLSLFACSHFRSNNDRQNNLTASELLSKICFTGSGKGRVQFFSGKYQFSYESLLESHKKKWVLALEIPLMGEEIFELSYSKDKKKKILGNFYSRLKNELSREQLKLLENHLNLFSEFLYLFDLWKSKTALLSGCSLEQLDRSGAICKMNNDVNLSIDKKSDSLLFKLENSAQEMIFLEFFQLDLGFYSKLKIYSKDKTQFGPEHKIFSLDLSINSCQL